MRQAQTGRVEFQEGENVGRFTHLRRVCGRDRRIVSAPTAAPITSQIEMAEVGSRAVSSPVAASNPEASPMQTRPPADTELRREWMGRRISTLVGRQPTLEETEAERQARMPTCKSSFGVIIL